MAETLLPQSIHPEDPDDEWVTSVNQGHSVRLRVLTAGLLGLLVLAGGFWGGVVAEKHHSSGSNTASALASRIAAARAAAGASGSTGASLGRGGAGGGAGLTTGTVINVQGNVIDISDSSGNIVKVQVGPSTTVTRTAKSAPSGLQIGDTVIVTGSAGNGGTVSASAVRASAQGISAGAGFGGFRGTGNSAVGGTGG